MFRMYPEGPPLPPACAVGVLGCHGRAAKFLRPTRPLAPARGIDGADDDGRTTGGSGSGAHRQHQTDRDNRTWHHDPIHTLILPWCAPVRLPIRRAGCVSGPCPPQVTPAPHSPLWDLIRLPPRGAVA